ncbi:MAG TPA: phytanoyl-CoA dioxygenase family protein [Polyangiaceae bacterium]|jgi:ectoine hydroxylase-related dioxygenase (phytanoyl-CoA dioxygenase family)|nr:phytanoyl-CoA dioxygenase family protein [Polyangiaceae bacterium]
MLAARTDLKDLLVELGLTSLATSALGVPAFPLDAIFFDKRSDANWAVPAHQDVIVPIPVGAPADAVRNRRERHGTLYGEPADLVLRELVALRVHFDDACTESGGLAIVDGSHASGRLADAEIRNIPLDAFRPYDCRAGDVLLMKPLVVHRSGRSTSGASRRVLHVLYAPRSHAQLAVP